MSVVPTVQSGMAAGINDTFRQVGVAVGVAVWGSIFVARGTAKVGQLLAGTPVGTGDRPRHLVEASSSGNLHAVLGSVPAALRHAVAHAARQGFITGFNDVMTLGAFVCLVGAVLALCLVRESDLERASVDMPHGIPGTARYSQLAPDARANHHSARPAQSPHELNRPRRR